MNSKRGSSKRGARTPEPLRVLPKNQYKQFTILSFSCLFEMFNVSIHDLKVNLACTLKSLRKYIYIENVKRQLDEKIVKRFLSQCPSKVQTPAAGHGSPGSAFETWP